MCRGPPATRSKCRCRCRRLPIVLTDTAGLRETDERSSGSASSARAGLVEGADVLLWLGEPARGA